jgi:selenocysteine-specific translation elongation factor
MRLAVESSIRPSSRTLHILADDLLKIPFRRIAVHMKHMHVAALELDAEFAKKIGKKGSESDFTIYNCKEGDGVLCIYHANKYPEKIQPLLYALSLADAAYLRPLAIDKETGEMIVAAAAFKRKLFVIVDRVSKEEVEPLLKAAGIAAYEFFEGDANALRERLAREEGTRKPEGRTEVVIDSCFPVKGVGTVALGIVQQGSVSVHQKLEFSPSGISAEVKSIQVQDEDVKDAGVGSRVGLNLKGLEPGKVGKGDLACEVKIAPVARIEAELSLSKFYKGTLEGVQFFVLSGLKAVACKAKKTGERHELELQSPICLRENETVCLFLPEAMPRVIGSARVAKIIS